MLISAALEKALTMMGIALPLMFLVIGVVIGATIVLRRAFPVPVEGGGNDATKLEQGGKHE